MVVADLIALCIVFGLLGIGGKSLFSALAQHRENKKTRETEQAKMRDALLAALVSHKKQPLEDFLVVWGDKLSKLGRAGVKQRIDELTIEENP